MPISFGGIITGGIQDVSALLPLLGTEQCEEHAGIALEKGFLYAVATPLSLFGSLGIVKAALLILLATLRFQRLGFFGARKLRDAGFKLSGSVASLIAVDPDLPTRYLAESRLLHTLGESVNFKNLRIRLEVWKWNRKLVVSSVIASLLGIVPYLYLNLAGTTMRMSLAWTFPALRIGSSYLCCIVTQLILQDRITSLISQRILFQSLEDSMLQHSHDGTFTQDLKDLGIQWDSRRDAESCLASLHNSGVLYNPDYRGLKSYLLDSERQLSTQIHSGWTRWQEMYFVVQQVILLVASIGVVIGYIGCFTVVQAATSPYGPLSWLCLEAGLSLIRVAIWAWNPKWDDNDAGLRLVLRLSEDWSIGKPQRLRLEPDFFAIEHSKFWERPGKFWKGLEPYMGSLPPFSHSGFGLYLTLGDFEENGSNSIGFCGTVVHSLTNKAIFVRYTQSGGLLKPFFQVVKVRFDNDLIHARIPGTHPDAECCDENISEVFPIPLLEDVHVYIAYITHAYATSLVGCPIVTGWTITSKHVPSSYVTYIQSSLLSAEKANQIQRARWTKWIEVVLCVIMREEWADVCSSDQQAFNLPTAQLLLKEAWMIELHYLEWLVDAEKSLSVRQDAFLNTIYGWEEKSWLLDKWRRWYNLRLLEDTRLATKRLEVYFRMLRGSDDHFIKELRKEYNAAHLLTSDYSTVKDRLHREREGLASFIASDTMSGGHTSSRLRRRIADRLQMAEYWMRLFFHPVSSRFDQSFSTHYGLSKETFRFLAEIMCSRCVNINDDELDLLAILQAIAALHRVSSLAFKFVWNVLATVREARVQKWWQEVSSWLQGPEGERFLSKAFKLRKDLGLDTMYVAASCKGGFNEVLGNVLDSGIIVTMPEQARNSVTLQRYPQYTSHVTAGSWEAMVYFTGKPSDAAPHPLLFIPLRPANDNSAIVEIISKSEGPKDLSLIILHRNPSANTTGDLRVSVMRRNTNDSNSGTLLDDLDVPPPNGASVIVPYKVPDIKQGNTKVTLTPVSGLWEVRFIKVVASEDVDKWVEVN